MLKAIVNMPHTMPLFIPAGMAGACSATSSRCCSSFHIDPCCLCYHHPTPGVVEWSSVFILHHVCHWGECKQAADGPHAAPQHRRVSQATQLGAVCAT